MIGMRIASLIVILAWGGCQAHPRGIGDPKYLIAYSVIQQGDRWVWHFDFCGKPRRPTRHVLRIYVWYSGAQIQGEPVCTTSPDKISLNPWPHGDGLLARDGSPCLLGTGRYHLEVSPGFTGTEFEITPSGGMRVLEEQCPDETK